MKQMKNYVIPILAAGGLFVLILDAQTAVSGAKEGIQLCIETLIPSLFPFFVISGYFCRVYSEIDLPFMNPILRVCGIPKGTGSLFILGMLGGYPVGAKAIADMYREGRLQAGAARRLLGFCSNAGPAFVFGVAGGMFKTSLAPWMLLAIQFLSAIATGFLLPRTESRTAVQSRITQNVRFSQVFEGSIKAIASVCGWVILFRVIITMLKRWFLWLLPNTAQIILTGILELSNGCMALAEIGNSGLRFIICSGILSFGGLCVYLQTVSVTEQLGTGFYFPGKFLQCLISLMLSYIAQYILFDPQNRIPLQICIIPVSILLICFVIIKMTHSKKTVAIPQRLMYNTVNHL